MDLTDERLQAEQASKFWWLFLITGILWLILSLLVFQFNASSIVTVGILVGVLILIAGINEFIAIGIVNGGWKWAHGILGVLFVLFGLFALIYPTRTFFLLADIIAFVLLFKGIFDIIVAFVTMHQNHLWWLLLISGGIEIGLAFWAAESLGRSAYIVVIWTGVWAMLRGITEIILAFQAHHLKNQLSGQTAAAPTPQPSGPAAEPSAPSA